MSTSLFGSAISNLNGPIAPCRPERSPNDPGADEVTAKSPADLLEEFERNFGRAGPGERLLEIGLAACPSFGLLGCMLFS